MRVLIVRILQTQKNTTFMQIFGFVKFTRSLIQIFNRITFCFRALGVTTNTYSTFVLSPLHVTFGTCKLLSNSMIFNRVLLSLCHKLSVVLLSQCHHKQRWQCLFVYVCICKLNFGSFTILVLSWKKNSWRKWLVSSYISINIRPKFLLNFINLFCSYRDWFRPMWNKKRAGSYFLSRNFVFVNDVHKCSNKCARKMKIV